MAEIKTPPVPARLVESIVSEDAPPGAIKFYNAEGFCPRGFHFQCPCGCRSVGGVRVAGPHAWRWSGDREAPTVSPSVLLHDENLQPHWHGWLKNGVWESC